MVITLRIYNGENFVRVQSSLQLGSFIPLAQVPSEVNAECVDAYAQGVIENYISAGQLDREQEGERQLLSCDIYRYLRGCKSNSEECTRPCMYIKDVITPEQIAEYPGVKENFDAFHQISSKLFQPYHIYTKAVGRVGLRMGFGLTNEGKQELDTTLSSLSCVERLKQIHEHLDTPLYFYPAEPMQLQIQIPNHQTVSVTANAYSQLTIENNLYSSIEYGINFAPMQRPNNEFIINGLQLKADLEKIADQLQFTQKEKQDFITTWYKKLPRVNYYRSGLFEQAIAQQIAKWRVLPQPNTEIRYIFYFKPLLEKPSDISDDFNLIPIFRRGFTVVDIGGIIDY